MILRRPPTGAGAPRPRWQRPPDTKAELLRSLPGFGSLPARERSRLARAFDERVVPTGAVLTRAGEPCRELVLVVEGRAVEPFEDNGGVEVGPGAFLGDAWLRRGGHPWTLVAANPMRLLVAGPDRAADLLRDADVPRPSPPTSPPASTTGCRPSARPTKRVSRSGPSPRPATAEQPPVAARQSRHRAPS